MTSENTDKSRPAFAVWAGSEKEQDRSVYLVARIGDLDCEGMCVASDFSILGKAGKPGEPPTIRRDFIRDHIYTCKHRDNFMLRTIWTDFRYEAYPLSDEDVVFFRPFIDAIERVYARK